MTLQYAVCDTCGLKHLAAPGSDEAAEFFHRHHNHVVRLIRPDPVLAKLRSRFGVDLFRETYNRVTRWGREQERRFEMARLGVAGYRDNANVKVAYGTATAMTITNANLATSATAGWQSAAIDNTSNLYLDYLFHVALAAVNTAPANSKAIFMFAHGLVDSAGAVYTSTGDGTPGASEATMTFPDVTTLPTVCPPLGTIPYPVQNKIINGGPFSFSGAFGIQNTGALPKLLISMINHSGMTLNVTSITYLGAYDTVV